MKNGTIFERLNLQGQELQSNERKSEINQDNNQENLSVINLKNEETGGSLDRKKDNHISPNQFGNYSSYLSFFFRFN